MEALLRLLANVPLQSAMRQPAERVLANAARRKQIAIINAEIEVLKLDLASKQAELAEVLAQVETAHLPASALDAASIQTGH